MKPTPITPNTPNTPDTQHTSAAIFTSPRPSPAKRFRIESLVMWLLAMAAILLPVVLLQGQTSSPVTPATPVTPVITSHDTSPVAYAASDKTPVKVAVLTYANGKTSQCFAPGFLTTVARHTRIVVQEEFSHATLGQAKLHQFPFIIMTGEGAFTLSDDEKAALKTYLQRGGFLLASPGCSNEPWSNSFTTLIKELFPDQTLEQLKMDHPVFHSIYDINDLPSRKTGTSGHIDGLTLGGRLVTLFSPLGLNDTENAGGGCCCCGGNELKDAHRINANILAYVLTH